MSSIKSALKKLSLRRGSNSQDDHPSPPLSPSKHRISSDQARSTAASASASRRSSLATDQTVPLAGRRSEDRSIPVPSSPAERRSLDGLEAASPSKSIPRSHKTFQLPTIPATPAVEDSGTGYSFPLPPGSSSTHAKQVGSDELASSETPPRLPAIRQHSDLRTSTMGLDKLAIAEGSNRVWNENEAEVLESKHDLTNPRQLFPVVIPGTDTPENASFSRAAQDTTRPQSTSIPISAPTSAPLISTITAPATRPTPQPTAPPNPAYIGTRSYSIGFPSASSVVPDSVHKAHMEKHLALLGPGLFEPMLRNPGGVKPGRHVPMQAGPVMAVEERDQILGMQRHSLLTSVASGDFGEGSGRVKLPQGDATRALSTGGGRVDVEAEKRRVFESAGWAERLGVEDTVEMDTVMLEPVVQEHVIPIVTNIYEFLLIREIHEYHIYPYIQPIHDPSPTYLPTRHLFPDPSLPPFADGNPAYRLIIGDEQAELVLGRKLTEEDRKNTTYERWVECVDGVRYERGREREGVEVGKRGWEEKIGGREEGRSGEQVLGAGQSLPSASRTPAAGNTATPSSPLSRGVTGGEEIMGRAV